MRGLDREQDPLIAGNYHRYLKLLCDRAASLASKDYFENTAKRQESCKTMRLPDGGELCAYFVRQDRFPWEQRQVLYLKSEHEEGQVLNSASEENYFQEDRIRQSLATFDGLKLLL